MSKSTTMLRTRRKDNNVKPNRRLDRKSSRGMLFENEELRLKTININAEVERGQSDIKKLKRENDQLRREIWYLRDEYDKLDKLLREKACQDSSSSSCSSESESCSSCTEESEAVETSQNKENFQKTNFKKITEEFDLLSVVPEENSTENSDKNNSNRVSPSDTTTNQLENNIIQADQSYPELNKPLPMPKHFFSPIKMSKANDDYVNNQFLGPESPYAEPSFTENYETLEQKNQNGFVSPSETYPGFILPSLNKSTTDLIVKTDNKNFAARQSQSSFSNGGNLEELLNDIETISHDILKMSNNQNTIEPPQSFCPFPNFLPNDDYFPTYQNDNFDGISQPQYISGISTSRPYKSELNVVLMPSPMQLIGVEKYKNIQKSGESLNGRSLENLSSSCHNIKIPENRPNLLTPVSFYGSTNHTPIATPNPPDFFQPIVPVPPFCPGPENKLFLENLQHQNLVNEQTNPFFFGNVRQQQNDYFHGNYVPDHFINKESDIQIDTSNKTPTSLKKESEIYNSKTNLIETASSDHVSSENEENLKFKTSRNVTDKPIESLKKETKESTKSPKLNIRRKVSIHFKGKKDKSKAKTSDGTKPEDKQKSPVLDKKSSFFDLKFSTESKEKKLLRQKSVAVESALEAKPPSGSEVKTSSSSDNKITKSDVKNVESSSSDQKSFTNDKKTPAHFDAKMSDPKSLDRSRKSSSASPERKHGHNKDKKCHKKHKKTEKIRRSSVSIDRFGRERSYSICTDRSNILDHRLGLHNYDDFTTSDRERTNSLSSCDTLKGRKLSNIQTLRQTGKIPWCGCWGNGCV